MCASSWFFIRNLTVYNCIWKVAGSNADGDAGCPERGTWSSSSVSPHKYLGESMGSSKPFPIHLHPQFFHSQLCSLRHWQCREVKHRILDTLYCSAYRHLDRISTQIRLKLHAHEFNPLNPELNPICYLLALLGAHHFLHVSRIRVKLLTFRQLMSNIYGAPILDVSRSHTTTQHSR